MTEKTVSVNGRDYHWPKEPLVVICCDGSEPAYMDVARDTGLMPNLDRILGKGETHLAKSVIPSFTNFIMTGFADDKGEKAEALTVHLFEDVGIIVNRTREAGLEGFIRFSLSLPEHNDLLLESVERFMT